jgi:sulfopyruvate decarboxylase TPP-binding subunit
MVKAKEFWDYLCGELDYRFFSGVACPGLSHLYNKMNSKFMHYVPAVNERVGLGLVNGAYMSGLKGGLLMDMTFIYDITSYIRFNVENRIPLLIIGYCSGEEESGFYDFPTAYIMDGEFKIDIKRVADKSEKEKVPGLIVIEEGALS